MPERLSSYHIFSPWIWQILLLCQIIELGYFNKLETLNILKDVSLFCILARTEQEVKRVLKKNNRNHSEKASKRR